MLTSEIAVHDAVRVQVLQRARCVHRHHDQMPARGWVFAHKHIHRAALTHAHAHAPINTDTHTHTQHARTCTKFGDNRRRLLAYGDDGEHVAVRRQGTHCRTLALELSHCFRFLCTHTHMIQTHKLGQSRTFLVRG
jgi:hypothetical protein